MISRQPGPTLHDICILLCLVAMGTPMVPVDAAPPGIDKSIVDAPLEAFLASPSTGRRAGKDPVQTLRSRLIKPGVRLLDGETTTLFVYREAAGGIYGLPAVIPLGQFVAYKYQKDQERLIASKLGEKPKRDPRRGSGGLVNIKIPVKVPKALSVITGEGETNLNITTTRRIDLSGTKRSTSGQAQTARTRPTPFTVNFEQESQLNVQGTIGDRISIELQEDSRSQRDIGETLRLRYDGDEDGIIEEIEAGSTSLTLPNTRLVGFNAQNRGGLFGIKTRGRLGGLKFTVVTTQDKGASNRKTFQGQAEETANDIRDFQYLEDVYFFLDRDYRDAFPDEPAARDLVDINTLRVFVNDFNDINDIEQRAIPGAAFAFWNDNGAPNETLSQPQGGGLEEGSFHELERDQFLVDARGYLIIRRGRVFPGWALGVAYRTADGRTFGDLSFIPNPQNPDTRIRLKLLKARQQRPDFPTWDLSWRNVYSLSGRNIEPQGFELQILRDVPGQEPVDNQSGRPYLQIFGLDTHTNGSSESSSPDNIIDIDGGNNLPGLNLRDGHLVFSTLEPFGARGVGVEELDNNARAPEIYTTTNSTTRREKSKFFMRIRSKSRATQYNLGPGIIENTEEVILNNRRLVRGQDYSIEYQFGTVKIIGDAAEQASDPSANLTINYSSKSLFGGFGGQKSLLGIRVEHPFKDNFSRVGLTLLYGSQGAASPRVRVGEEPKRTIIWDANARFRLQPQAITDMVNKLPFVATETPSSLTIDAEVAQSLPNPNTRGVAYIDDFEGTEDRQAFSIYKRALTSASTPVLNSSTILLPKGRLTSYNPVERDRISIFRIQPNRDDIPAEQSIVETLHLRFDPHRTNGFPERTRNTEGGFPEMSWAGITQYLDGLDPSRSKFLELWVRGNAGRLHIDMGEISERVALPLDHPIHNPPPPRDFRTEDEPLPGLPRGDDVATSEEDIGLDGLTDAQEDSIFQLIYPGSLSPADPSGDNFADVDLRQEANLLRYPSGVNGTQGNNPERDSTPDTEDLNRNGILDDRNSFVRYSIDLGTNQGFNSETGVYNGPSLLVEGTRSDPTDRPWRLIRIPLRGRTAPRTEEGGPDTTFASAIDFARLWIEHNDTTSIQLYSLDIVGSDWLEDPPPFTQQSGDFKVASIGTDNAVYESPPDLEREVNPTTGLRLLERSLDLKFEDLYPGEHISASRTFFQRGNYTQYGTMTMFVHGGNPSNPASEQNFPAQGDTLGGTLSPIELFLRFAPISGDTLNFYEYRTRVYRGWAPDVNTVEIDLELMSQLKGQLFDLRTSGRASSDTLSLSLQKGDLQARYSKEVNRIEVDLGGKTYVVRGNPALSEIKFFTLGIRNLSDRILEGENEIWVDELRLDNIRKKRALSGLLNLRTVLADLGNLSVNLERKSGDFQDLQGRASGNTTSRVSLNAQLNLSKFLPKSWHTSVPVRFSYDRNTTVPRIRRGSDIVLTPQQKAKESDIRTGARFNVSLRKRAAPEAPRLLARLFFDRMSASLNFSTQSSQTGAITRRQSSSNENLNGTFSYDLNWPQRKSLRPFGWLPFFKSLKDAELFYLPSNIRYNVRFNRSLRDQRSFSAVTGDTSDVIATLNETFGLTEVYALKLTPFKSLSASYDLNVNRDLRNSFAFTLLQLGRETNRHQNVSFGYSPRISRWFTFSTQYASRYRENLETGGQRSVYGNTRRGLTTNSTNNTNVRVSLNTPSLFQPLARRPKKGFSLLRLIGRAGASLSPLQATASRAKTFNLFGLRSRPPFKFQFGFTDTAHVEVFRTGGVTRINTRVTTDRASLSSSVRLPLGVNMQGSASYNHSRKFGNAITENESITLPNLSARWRGLERLPVFRWLLTSSNFNFSYQNVHTRGGDGGLGALSLTGDSRKTAYNPLISWSGRWKNQMTTTVRSNRSQQSALRYQRNVTADTATVQPTLQERLIGTTLEESSAIQGNLKYTLKFFKKLQSNIDLDLGYRKSSSLQKELPKSTAPEEPVEPVIRRSESTWQGSLAAQYRFSSQFTGGAKLRHESRMDRLRELTNRTWEFRLWGEIRFN